MLVSVVKSCTLTQSIYCFCLGHSDFQMYHFYNCFLGLKAWQGISNASLVAYCFLLVGFTVSDWVSTFCLTLYCVIQYARAQATLEPRRKKKKRWNAAKQFCWHLPVWFHSQSVNPWSFTTIWNSKANAESTPSRELAPMEKFVKTALALNHWMFSAQEESWHHSQITHGPTQRKDVRSSEFLPLQLLYDFNTEVYKKYYFSLKRVPWHHFLVMKVCPLIFP